MATLFPSEDWLRELETKLNSDTRYGEVAKNWEGDIVIVVEPGGNLKEKLNIYFDLWHGKCRRAEYAVDPAKYPSPVFTLTATYPDITRIAMGKMDPMTAMMTNKLRVKGSLGYMMRNVPTVLDFVRCVKEVTSESQIL